MKACYKGTAKARERKAWEAGSGQRILTTHYPETPTKITPTNMLVVARCYSALIVPLGKTACTATFWNFRSTLLVALMVT